ncbi:MAG: START domain-containing protein [Chitinophagales bacterium]
MKKSIILTTLFAFIVSLSFAQTDWELKKEKNGIKVYTKTKAGQTLKASKAEMTVDASVDDILGVLNDIPNYVNWTPKTESAKLLKQVSSTEYYYYTVIKAPMVSNRDLVAHVKIYESGGSTIVDMTGDPDYIDEDEDLVRMPSYKGVYTLTAQGNGKTKIVLEYSADPGGNLPDWMVNTAAVDVPYDMFMDLEEQF